MSVSVAVSTYGGSGRAIGWLGTSLALVGLALVIKGYKPSLDYLPLFALGLTIVLAPIPPRGRMMLAVALGVVLRLYFFSTASADQGDAWSYQDMANRLLAGEGLKVVHPIYGTYQALYPPLYPILLALLGTIPLSLAADSFSTFAINRLGNDKAAAAYFLFPSVILSAAMPAKEGLAIALLLGLMLVRNPLAYGAVSGALALTQPAWVIIAVLAFVFERGVQPKPVALAALGGVAVLAPWWVRNWLLFHEFIPLTSGFWMALSVNALGGQHIEFAKFGGEAQILAASKKVAIDAISANPLGYILNSVKNAVVVFAESDDLPLAYNRAGFSSSLILVSQLAWLALFPRFRIPPRNVACFLLAGLVAVAVQMWTEFGVRHIMYFVPLLLIAQTSRGIPAPSMAYLRLASRRSDP